MKVELNDILKMEPNELMNLLIHLFPNAITDGHNYLYQPIEDSKLCLVAHIDTVSRLECVPLCENNIIRNPKGVLGADDRAGVFAALKTYLHKPVSLLFTNYEECGGLGMKKFLLTKPDLNKYTLFIVLDRQGANDYVYYSRTLPNEIKQYIESFGFKESFGSYNDVVHLTDYCGIPHVNLSVGYYNQHSANEWLDTKILSVNMKRFNNIVDRPLEKLYEIKKVDYTFKSYWKEWEDYEPELRYRFSC